MQTKNKKIKLRYFDLFSGIGGFRLAAETLKNTEFDFEHVAYCEIDPQARSLYDKFTGTEKIQIIDDANAIRTDSNKQGLLINDFDILFAGFPCQSFSNVGYRKGMDDVRGQLFFIILDILKYYNPKYFILENVQKLSTIERGKLLSEMSSALKEIGLGYNVQVWDLYANEYGLPQNRRRIFFCGARTDISENKILSSPPKINLLKAAYPTVWHLLEKHDVDTKHFIPHKTRSTVLYKNPNWAGDVNIDNPIARPITASMSKWHRANQDNYYSLSYISSNKPYTRPMVDLAHEPIRRITPLEGFRIQGFPDFYSEQSNRLQLKYSTQYRLIGNAVPVNLAKSVIDHFINSNK